MGLDLVISEILDSFRRKEDILCIQSDCLSVMLKYKSFRSPAVALERTIRILQNKILSFTFLRSHLVPAAMMQAYRALGTLKIISYVYMV